MKWFDIWKWLVICDLYLLLGLRTNNSAVIHGAIQNQNYIFILVWPWVFLLSFSSHHYYGSTHLQVCFPSSIDQHHLCTIIMGIVPKVSCHINMFSDIHWSTSFMHHYYGYCAQSLMPHKYVFHHPSSFGQLVSLRFSSRLIYVLPVFDEFISIFRWCRCWILILFSANDGILCWVEL